MIEHPRAEIWIALAAFLLALTAPHVIRVTGAGAAQPSFHIDEAHKIAESYYYHLFFEAGDWTAPEWSEDFFARTNPPVAKYVFGVALALGGEHVHDQELQQAFYTLWRNPDDLRGALPDRMLAITRFVSGLFGALACGLMALVATRAGGILAGIVAPLLLVLNPVFVYVASRGLTDTIFLFHLLLVVPASWGAIRALQRLVSDGPAGASPLVVLRGLVLPS
ncbi:unnamed protein product, partial [marine sediment metagenome]